MDLVPSYTIPDARYAVLLNANAGRVTPRLTAAIREVVPKDRLFLTESPEHANEVLHRCVEQELGTVFAGGGDGTIIEVLNSLQRISGEAPKIPSVGVLRLGTGNALAHWLHSGPPVRELRRWRRGMVHRLVPIQMVEAEGTFFPFGGLGYDAAVLNDYIAFKAAGKDRWWSGLAKGVAGYVMAGLSRTVPRYLRRRPVRVRVINLGRPAYRIGADGAEIGDPIDTGEILHEGPCTMLGAATTPLYGYGMRMFPHATRRAGRFQLRLMNLSPLESLANVVPAWKGTLQHEKLTDFYADRVRVIFDDAMPYQLGGDARGYRRELTFSLSSFPVNLVGHA